MAIAALFDAIRLLARASITGSYVSVGTALTHIPRIIIFSNTTDGDMYFSTDASTDMLIVPKNSNIAIDLTANREANQTLLTIAIGTQFSVKQASAPTAGLGVFISMIYGKGE